MDRDGEREKRLKQRVIESYGWTLHDDAGTFATASENGVKHTLCIKLRRQTPITRGDSWN
jgi:hypothetical protein